jgi:lipopolysaccharide biosynthesis glycosyltransferase
LEKIMSTACAVCYVSDFNYLLPSIVSATGLRKFVPAHKADIFIFLVDVDAVRIRDFNLRLSPYGIRILAMDSRSYGGFDPEMFRGYMSPATLGRFAMDGMLPNATRRIVYIDCDTWIRRDPSALIEAIIPEGKFAAVSDTMYFRSNSVSPAGRRFQSYFRKLGLSPKTEYFNAGVFAAARSTWKVLAPEAFTFFKNNMDLCKFRGQNDQSALNAVVGDRRLRLSLKWNFQSAARFMGVEKNIEPAIYHFTQYSKPWMGECKPWQNLHADYREALKPFDSLALPIKKLDKAEVAAVNRLNLAKNLLLKSPFTARLASLHMRIQTYESRAWL